MESFAMTKDYMNQYVRVVFGFASSFTMKAVLDLHIPDILAKAPGGKLTLDEIAAQLPSKTVHLDYLGRIMTFAVLNGLFAEEATTTTTAKQGENRFCMTPVSTMLTEGDHGGINGLLPLTRLWLTKGCVEPYMNLAEAVLSGTDPFQLTHGAPVWEFAKNHPEWAAAFDKSMASASSFYAGPVIQAYRGFQGVKRLVDVGGGKGSLLANITKAYPSIQGINFDQPQVIAQAPEIPGVTHVGGNMFEKVPEGDAIIMKNVLHDWGDQDSIHILKNCHDALAEGGKIILVELEVAEPKTVEEVAYDMLMLVTTATGRERTALQFHQLLKASGFQRMEITSTPVLMNIIEAYKS